MRGLLGHQAAPCGVLVVLLIVGSFHNEADAVNISRVPMGCLTHPLGQVRLQRAEYDLVIVRHSPQMVRQDMLLPFTNLVSSLINAIDQHLPTMGVMYRHRLEDYKNAGRSKRGLFDFIGTIASKLFGTATTGQVRKLANTVNTMADSVNQQGIAINELTVVLNQTIMQQQRIASRVNFLSQQLEQVYRVMSALNVMLTNITKEVNLNRACLTIENSLSLLEEQKQAELYEIRRFELQRDFVEVGHLTDSLLSRVQLQTIRQGVHIELSDDYLYGNLPVRLMSLGQHTIGYWLSVPVLEGETFSGWSIATVPVVLPQGPGIVEPEAYKVGVGLKSGNVIILDGCEYTDPILCRSPVEFNDLPCVRGILTGNKAAIEKCDIVPINTFARVKKVAPGILLVSTTGEDLEV